MTSPTSETDRGDFKVGDRVRITTLPDSPTGVVFGFDGNRAALLPILVRYDDWRRTPGAFGPWELEVYDDLSLFGG